VRERALGQEVLKSITPGQQVVKIVHDELTALMGAGSSKLVFTGRPPTVILLAGLQGSGKTTTAAKLALLLRKEGRKPGLVAADLQRPAAIDQLEQLGKQIQIPVYREDGSDPVAVVRNGIEALDADTIILDTAGRLHVDEALMDELRRVAAVLAPEETLFVADSMTGQDAVKSAEQFAAALPLTGAILTKLDGDSRGGAALSIRTVAEVPIRFVGTGEKPEELELFHPERMASRMIGMGDVLSLIEKAERGLDAAETERLAKRIVSQQFTLEDLRDQLRQLRKLGPLASVLEMLPKVGPLRGLDSASVDEGGLQKVEAIINSMTPLERRRPDVLNGGRKKRIAMGSGTSVAEINRLLKQYRTMQKMMKGVQGKWLRRAMGSGGQARA
jgi:signal recognition particle subunit SRP54